MTTPCPGFFRHSPMGRREFLRAGSLSLFGLGLPELLEARALAPGTGKAKACILLFMWGGPAQQDTWDPKPDENKRARPLFSARPSESGQTQ